MAATVALVMNADGQTFTLAEDVSYDLGSAKIPLKVTVPKGYQTDLASIPSWAGIFGFDKLGAHSHAAILHDYLWSDCQLDYEMVTAMFYAQLRLDVVTGWRARIMALAVELGGKARWDSNRRAQGY